MVRERQEKRPHLKVQKTQRTTMFEKMEVVQYVNAKNLRRDPQGVKNVQEASEKTGRASSKKIF